MLVLVLLTLTLLIVSYYIRTSIIRPTHLQWKSGLTWGEGDNLVVKYCWMHMTSGQTRGMAFDRSCLYKRGGDYFLCITIVKEARNSRQFVSLLEVMEYLLRESLTYLDLILKHIWQKRFMKILMKNTINKICLMLNI